IPARCEALLNFRYAPGRTMGDAEARVRELVGRELEIVDHAPAAHVPSRAPLVERLRTAGDFDVQPKQAWTNVADFAARGLDAVNLGPGATRYAHAADLPELRAAIRSWIVRRYEVEVEDRELLPTLGSKEAIFSFAHVALGEKRGVAVPEPGYPVYERGARFAGGTVVPVPLREENGWLPDLDAFDGWDEIALFWICYPNNPTGATAPLSFYEELAGLAREHGFLVCSDEAYSELWFDEPPASALQVADRENVVGFNTLSKRSSMTGYRSGFACAPLVVADALPAFP